MVTLRWLVYVCVYAFTVILLRFYVYVTFALITPRCLVLRLPVLRYTTVVTFGCFIATHVAAFGFARLVERVDFVVTHTRYGYLPLPVTRCGCLYALLLFALFTLVRCVVVVAFVDTHLLLTVTL